MGNQYLLSAVENSQEISTALFHLKCENYFPIPYCFNLFAMAVWETPKR